MNPPPFHPIAGALAALARDAVVLQGKFDKAHVQELALFEAVLAAAATPDAARIGAGPLLPARVWVARHEISCRVRVEVDRSIGFSIRVMPLNAGYDLRYATTHSSDMVLRLEVVQAPASTNNGGISTGGV